MMYLQEKRLLVTYYEAFRDAKGDQTGLETLKRVIGPQALGDFEKAWRGWVMGLEFRSGA
jgi:hypothetical protein